MPRLAQRLRISQPRRLAGFFVRLKHQADDVIERTRPDEQEEEFPIPGRVENVAADEQPDFSSIVASQRPVDGEDREEKPEESELNEKHGFLRLTRPTDKLLREQARKFFGAFLGQMRVIDADFRVV